MFMTPLNSNYNVSNTTPIPKCSTDNTRTLSTKIQFTSSTMNLLSRWSMPKPWFWLKNWPIRTIWSMFFRSIQIITLRIWPKCPTLFNSPLHQLILRHWPATTSISTIETQPQQSCSIIVRANICKLALLERSIIMWVLRFYQ